ncbi:MAG: HD domain-containing phosphohydrolase [Betaproteobacteria bacterium]
MNVTPPVTEAGAGVDTEPSLGDLARPVFDAVTDAILICDAATLRVLFANPAAIALYGYSIAEFRAMPVTALSLDPEAAINHIRTAERDGKTTREERRHRHRNGDALLIEVSATTVDWHGQRLLLAVVRDARERQRFEEALRTSEAQSRQYAQQVEQALMETVTSISMMVELRDPYTHGHEGHVASLAAAIALDLGMGDNSAKGLRVAGMLHDIGKVGVPSEILNFPGRLSPIQLLLVQEHPQKGYDVLRGIHFPWPVANAVLQHHERLDGSGYPSGLRGDAICMEARVLAVADVVDAMASHRPYRPALGIEKALAEIETHAGVLFDPAVVASCLRLFREKNYKLFLPGAN